MRHRWRKVDEALFAAAISGRDGARYHLTAEQLPGTDDWDWTVWRPGDAPETARYGGTTSADTAMRAAEAAASHWDDRAAPASFADS